VHCVCICIQVSDNGRERILHIFMEHAVGGDIGQLIDERKRSGRRFSEAECLKTISQAASALAYCHHTLFLLHRDIKPANIFLTSALPAANGRTPGDIKLGSVDSSDPTPLATLGLMSD
jgi:serine/threonine protein kinase